MIVTYKACIKGGVVGVCYYYLLSYIHYMCLCVAVQKTQGTRNLEQSRTRDHELEESQ